MKDLAHEGLYRNDARKIPVIFDLRSPQAVEALRWWPVVWRGQMDVERLDEDHVVLALAPGGASRRVKT